MNAGQLVPDDTVCGIVSDRIRESDARRGFVLDGFPRTVAQAERLSAQLREDNNDIDVVIVLEVPEPVIVSRLSGRRTCSGCGASFHVELAAPKTAGSCDVCGAALVQRPDDAESAVRQRLVEYRAKTMPLVEHFRRTTPMVVVDGVGTPEDVHHQISDALERLAVGPEAE
jgi:adenylate kinase